MDKKWIKPRHKIITAIAYAILTPYTKLVYRIKLIPFKENKKRQHLILMNHQTAFDQFFIGMVFKKNIYYLALLNMTVRTMSTPIFRVVFLK